MTATFQLKGLDPAYFQPLFALGDEDLRSRGIERRFADAGGRYPCRVSLREADEGEEMLLLPFEHQPANSPYRASGPIFVRRDGMRADPAPGELPPYVTKRVISLRAYDAGHRIVDAAVAEGPAIEREVRRLLAHAEVSYLHLHNALRGCYSCLVTRA
jgi:hypothetical protein